MVLICQTINKLLLNTDYSNVIKQNGMKGKGNEGKNILYFSN
jgi:hypothetical protein